MTCRRLVRRAAPVVAALALALPAACGATDDALVRSTRPVPATAEATPSTDDVTTTGDATAHDDTTTADPTGDATPADDGDASASTRPPTDGTDPTRAGTITWDACEDEPKLECGRLDVPLDYADPTGPTITLQLQRSRAAKPGQRIGSLLVNPGGPGVSTLDDNYTFLFTLLFDQDIVDRFDIVGWDPRGVGHSDHVDCVDDLDPYLGAIDPTPDTPDERAAADAATADLVRRCQAANADLLPHISTQDSARDMEAIRQALGEDQISYFGFSYGSTLGATFATMFPRSVRAIVIDGARNPSSDGIEVAREQKVGIERGLDAVLADCADDPDCPFYSDGNPAAAFDQLFAFLETSPLPAPPGRPPIGQGVMAYATVSALYDQMMWEGLTTALAQARAGDGSGLLSLYDEYWQRASDGTWANTFEALVAINCVDGSETIDPSAVPALSAEMQRLAPRTGQWFIDEDTCASWPVRAPQLEITGAGAGPILVLGNTGDPVTPIESTTAMARALEGGRLVSFTGTGHVAYPEARLNRNSCLLDAVTDYLVDLTVPPEDVRCG